MSRFVRIIFFCIPLFYCTKALSTDNIDFSGFGRVVAGYLDDPNAQFNGYEEKVSLSEQSLIAIQADYHLTSKMTIAAQLLAHSAEDRDSGIEWLYLKYEPNQYWRLKAGKLRTPFYRFSDVLDVGFAYPWITPPPQIYRSFLFSSYEGATATYRFATEYANIDIEAYWGVYDDTIFTSGEEIAIEVNALKGIIATINTSEFQLRASYIKSSDFDADLPELSHFSETLDALGFTNNAETLRLNGSSEGYQLGAGYEGLSFFGSFEWMRIHSNLLLVPKVDSYYATIGYNYYPYQFHVTLASSDTTFDQVVNEIPKGVSPELDQLSFSYDGIVSSLPVDNLNSLTLGARWDFQLNMALKIEVTFLDGDEGQRNYFNILNESEFDRRARLYQVGIEWVF